MYLIFLAIPFLIDKAHLTVCFDCVLGKFDTKDPIFDSADLKKIV